MREAVSAFLKLVGGGLEQSKDNSGTWHLQITVDQSTLLEELPLLQKYGVFNEEMSATYARTHSNSLSLVAAIRGIHNGDPRKLSS